MKLLLTLKHWQLFLIFVLPMVITTDSFISRAIQFIWFLLLLAWIYLIGTTAYEKLQDKGGIKIYYFKANFVFIIGYLLAVRYVFNGEGYTITEQNYKDFGSAVWVMLPLHLYLMWSLIYAYYFAAKMLTSYLQQRVAGFDSYFTYMLGLWFFPVGVWYIQPKVNLLNQEEVAI